MVPRLQGTQITFQLKQKNLKYYQKSCNKSSNYIEILHKYIKKFEKAIYKI